MRIGNIIKIQQPAVFDQLMQLRKGNKANSDFLQNTNKLNFSDEGGYSEQQFNDLNEKYYYMMVEKSAVKI